MNVTPVIIIFLCFLLVGCALALWILLGKNHKKELSATRAQKAEANTQEKPEHPKRSLSGERGFKAAVLGLFGLLLARIGYMELLNNRTYTESAEKNRTRTVKIQAPRGRILDRNGVELVTNQATLALSATPDLADDEVEMHLLANLLGLPYEAFVAIVSGGSTTSALNTIYSNLDQKQVAFISEHPEVFPDVTIAEQQVRTYTQGELAAHVIGYTSEATQDQIDASKNSGNELVSGDLVGQAGVEAQYEDVLRGTDGEQQLYVSADGSILGSSETVPATAGSDVVLTIDAKIQAGAEAGLKHAVEVAKDMGKPAKAGALVCLDAQTGDVLAMASYPTFNPQVFSGGISSEDWDNLSNEASAYPLLNRAVSGMYPSASTIKPLASLAGLQTGVVDENSQFDCVGFWTGFGESSGQWCWNHNGHGWLGLKDGIINSCNTVFYEIGKRIFYSDSPDALQNEYEKWGLGQTLGIDLPSEGAGRIPTPEWKAEYYADYPGADTTWYGGDTTNIAIGQGDILVTPLQMAAVYLGLATDGTIYTPHVLKGVSTKDGTGTITEYETQVAHTIEPNTEQLNYVKGALANVVYEEDPAVAAHFANLPVQVAAKTGTAEQAGKEPSGWFCCYAPAENPTYVIACVIEEGGFGASSAMYAVRDTLGTIYDTPDTSTAVSTNQAM